MLKVIKFSLAIIIAGFSVNANAQVFGKSETKFDDIRDFKKWKDVIKKEELDMMVNGRVTQTWKDNISKIKALNLSREQKIVAVNEFVNKSLTYVDDGQVWGLSDYWATPTQSLTRGTGDCEDYALAKYFSLQQLGFTDNDMRLVILKDTRKNVLHAILVINNPNGGNYVLDNQNQSVMMDSQIAYYNPIYSINSSNWWKNS